MMSLHYRRFTPIACAILASGLLLTRLSISSDAETLAAKPSPEIHALVSIDKGHGGCGQSNESGSPTEDGFRLPRSNFSLNKKIQNIKTFSYGKE
jgi:hypothetical protein